ncbi:RraA family protein [Saccharomonospora sp. NPDC046836]|uniref:RraA family protein n=1 Tax=Saccharomonospora sp. NPDC046836 TaxID=3156921 RepID=UPI0033E5EEDC
MLDAKQRETLETAAKLRVTDIRDGMDWVGLHHVGSLPPEFRPLYPARAVGFARTARHLPTQQSVPTMSPEDYTKWAYDYWYGKVFASDFYNVVEEGSFLVVDTSGKETPAVGSMISMVWASRGARGAVTNGGVRDTDEIVTQAALPVWSRSVVQPMYQGRVEWGGHSMPVALGGQRINPDDLVVADHDGVIIVPQAVIDDVLTYAIQEAENDRRTRRMLFEHLGLAQDDSCKSLFDTGPHPRAMTEDKLRRMTGRP